MKPALPPSEPVVLGAVHPHLLKSGVLCSLPAKGASSPKRDWYMLLSALGKLLGLEVTTLLHERYRECSWPSRTVPEVSPQTAVFFAAVRPSSSLAWPLSRLISFKWVLAFPRPHYQFPAHSVRALLLSPSARMRLAALLPSQSWQCSVMTSAVHSWLPLAWFQLVSVHSVADC